MISCSPPLTPEWRQDDSPLPKFRVRFNQVSSFISDGFCVLECCRIACKLSVTYQYSEEIIRLLKFQ